MGRMRAQNRNAPEGSSIRGTESARGSSGEPIGCLSMASVERWTFSGGGVREGAFDDLGVAIIQDKSNKRGPKGPVTPVTSVVTGVEEKRRVAGWRRRASCGNLSQSGTRGGIREEAGGACNLVEELL